MEALNNKITLTMTSPNEIFNKDLRFDQIESICDSIESKLRKCQKILELYFSAINHDLITGTIPFHTVSIQKSFDLSGSVIIYNRSYNEINVYREEVSSEFQSFVIDIATCYENLIRLTEIVLKKIVIYGKQNNKNQSITFDVFRSYWDNLVNVNYRTDDNMYKCLKKHLEFFERFYPVITKLRNRAVHGYKALLIADSITYIINPECSNHLKSTELQCDIFVKKVFESTKIIITDFIKELTQEIEINRHIPI